MVLGLSLGFVFPSQQRSLDTPWIQGEISKFLATSVAQVPKYYISHNAILWHLVISPSVPAMFMSLKFHTTTWLSNSGSLLKKNVAQGEITLLTSL